MAMPTFPSTRNWATRASRPPTSRLSPFSVGEEELAGLDTKPLVGHLAAWNYFQSSMRPPMPSSSRPGTLPTRRQARDQRPDGSRLYRLQRWVKAVEAAGTTDTDPVLDQIIGTTVPKPVGRLCHRHAEPPHHQARDDRRNPGKRSVRDRPADPGSRGRRVVGLSADSKDLIADWRKPMSCGNFNVKTGKWRRQDHQLIGI